MRLNSGACFRLCKNQQSRNTYPGRLLETFRQLYVLLEVCYTASSNVYVSYHYQSGMRSESGGYIFLKLPLHSISLYPH